MQQNQGNSNDNNDDRNLDPYNALQKVIRIDKKHTNFEYYDKDRKVSYPNPPFQAPNNEHLLKGFWRHINNYYFKKIQQSELQRLEYLEVLLQPLNKCDVRFSGSSQFWYSVQRIFSDQYLNRYQKSNIWNLDCKNWLQSLYLVWQKTSTKEKNKSKIGNQLKKVENSFQNLENFSKIDDLKKQFTKLKIQEEDLEELLPLQDDDDQVSLQIKQLEAQLQMQSSQNHNLLETLKNRVRRQLNLQQITIIKFHDQQALQQKDEDHTLQQSQKMYKVKRKIQKMQTGQIIKTYLAGCIQNLQRKQVAESISKITSLQKGKNKQQSRFQIEFQTGMNLKSTIIVQSQMKQLNKLRQYNLLKFYNTSLKTPYSFICQNYYGFRWIYQNRLKPCELKEKDILEQMHKGKNDFAKTQAAKNFKNFDICHHCKLLYPEAFLTKCQYHSSKNGAPITPSSFYDPYVAQIVKLQQPKLSNRFAGKKRNCYLGYTKKNQQYTCQRKFCKYCVKQNYEEGLDKNGLCPFCQGVCFCTRCARNDMIVRLKSMFLLLGGDIYQLEEQSFLDKIANWDNEAIVAQSSRNISRSKIRPPKKQINGTPARLGEKMRNIRYQLEDLRILCDLVKRRQKQKQKLVQIRSQTFTKKVLAISKSFDFKGLNETSINSFHEEQKEHEREKQKMSKKLKRMIH